MTVLSEVREEAARYLRGAEDFARFRAAFYEKSAALDFNHESEVNRVVDELDGLIVARGAGELGARDFKAALLQAVSTTEVVSVEVSTVSATGDMTVSLGFSQKRTSNSLQQA